MPEYTSGSCRSSQRSLRRHQLLVDAVAALGDQRPLIPPCRSASTSSAQRKSLCWMLRLSGSPFPSSSTSAGSMPGHADRLDVFRAHPRRCEQFAEDLHGYRTTASGPAPPTGVIGNGKTLQLGRGWRLRSGGRIRMPIVDVVPTSTPMTHASTPKAALPLAAIRVQLQRARPTSRPP